jgi:hypothetical protein
MLNDAKQMFAEVGRKVLIKVFRAASQLAASKGFQ